MVGSRVVLSYQQDHEKVLFYPTRLWSHDRNGGGAGNKYLQVKQREPRSGQSRKLPQQETGLLWANGSTTPFLYKQHSKIVLVNP